VRSYSGNRMNFEIWAKMRAVSVAAICLATLFFS
jgi:hypothetical protein